jgi:hypothetical protein
MSKLATLLRRISRAEPAPMGFAAAASRTRNAEMLVAVSIKGLDLKAAQAAADKGADFLVLEDGDLEKDADKIRAITAGVKVPCGLRLTTTDAVAAATAHGLGVDYLRIEDEDTPAAVLLDDETGFVLSIADDAGDTMLRMLSSMPIEALFAGDVKTPFTLRRQIELRRLSAFAGKPLLLRGGADLTSADLECLRDSGVAGLLLDGSDTAKVLPAVKETIGAMRPRRRRREDRQEASPTLPSVGHGAEDEDEEE